MKLLNDVNIIAEEAVAYSCFQCFPIECNLSHYGIQKQANRNVLNRRHRLA